MRAVRYMIIVSVFLVIYGSQITPASAQVSLTPSTTQTQSLSKILSTLEQQGYRNFQEIEDENSY